MELDILLLNLARFSCICGGALLGLIFLKGLERVWRVSRSFVAVWEYTLAQSDKAAAMLVSLAYLALVITSHDRPAGSWMAVILNASVLLVFLGSIRGALIGSSDRWSVKGRERKE